jgi:SAM-dependent methyltransferase
MKTNTCRACGNIFFNKPLLKQLNMPKSAQYLPEKRDLQNDGGIDLEIFQCSGCGLVQLGCEPVPYYKEVIRAASISDEVKAFRRNQFERIINKFNLKNNKFIEIGCGRGDFLSVINEFEINASGLEYSMESVAFCLKNKLNVFQGFVDASDYKIKGAPFDFFLMLNFLEHLPEPIVALRGIYNNLSENGLGLVEVPNFDMILRNNLFSEFIPDHLLYFTRESLVGLLNNNGFEIIECNEERSEYVISALVKKKERLDISHFKGYQMRLEKDINHFIDQFGKKSVAIWGAGHQALAIISLAQLKDKIKYVIDSAPFKQNKYTPATHIKIVSPDSILSDPVDAIIVMAAAYSDEVIQLIRKNYDKRIKIAVVRDYGVDIPA